MNVLVINAGSSSLKYQLLVPESGEVLAKGLVERIGEAGAKLTHRAGDAEPLVVEERVADHSEGFERVFSAFETTGGPITDLAGIGHRVVHGGDRLTEPTLIDAEAIAAIHDQAPLAPLHNPSNLLGIRIAMASFPDTPQVAVFDTAFHQTMPPRAWRYALPADLAASFAPAEPSANGHAPTDPPADARASQAPSHAVREAAARSRRGTLLGFGPRKRGDVRAAFLRARHAARLVRRWGRPGERRGPARRRAGGRRCAGRRASRRARGRRCRARCPSRAARPPRRLTARTPPTTRRGTPPGR